MKAGQLDFSCPEKQVAMFSPIWADVYSHKMFIVSFSSALAGIAQMLVVEFLI